MTDEGFHPTVLTLWRNKLRASDRPQRIFDAVGAVVDTTGVLRGKARRVLDSTVLDDAVMTQDAVMQRVSAIRRVRRLVPEAKALELVAHDYDNDPGKPAWAWDDPDRIEQLITALVADALATLDAVAGLIWMSPRPTPSACWRSSPWPSSTASSPVWRSTPTPPTDPATPASRSAAEATTR